MLWVKADSSRFFSDNLLIEVVVLDGITHSMLVLYLCSHALISRDWQGSAPLCIHKIEFFLMFQILEATELAA